METKLLSLALFMALIISSCKKEDKQPSSSSTGGGGGGGNSPAVSTATAHSGIFNLSTNTFVTSSGPFVGSSAYAYFSSTPEPAIYTATSVKVNSVYLNGDSLKFDTSQNFYLSYMPVNAALETWSVNGANGIGTFSFTNSSALMPSATNCNAIPATISKAAGFTVAINVSNASYAEFIVYDGTSSSTAMYSQTVHAGNNVITVTPANLAALSTCTDGIIGLVMENKKAYTFSGKSYLFEKGAQYNQYLTITP
jgi:hypothetical protein